ncbi:MAG: single-stranded-DNA-specific exonuclease RecJ [Treponemataceae bacterium]|nr:single-stranded-DNA-specific exonuclease RecJ [Treponemataceae bacterium]
MSIWKKKIISKEVVKEINDHYKLNDYIKASILARRGITEGKDILYYTESDQRFMHNPFLFNTMEDAVDRIMDAVEEGEKVLIFGDRDVDGITSTIVLYDCLKDLGLDVSYRLPSNDETYGLSKEAIDDFAAIGGTLIITVDCGISNKDEIAYANDKSISVIVTDHHNPPAELPENTIIVNPKVEDCGYPFKDISGCAVSYKLTQALEFAKSDLYKQSICLMNVRPLNDSYAVECIKIENMAEKERIQEVIVPGLVDIYSTRLVSFLQGMQIFVWDLQLQKKMLTEIFGKNIEFNLMDIRPEISKLFPQLANLSLLRLKEHSKIAIYDEKLNTELDSFFNIFITYIQKIVFKANSEKNLYNLQLVALAALADIMPLKDENRIFLKQGLASFNSGKIRPGLLELFARLDLLGKHISSITMGWDIIPYLNATGRLGEPEKAIQLLDCPDPAKRDEIAAKIIEMNKQRKAMGNEAWNFVQMAGRNSLEEYGNNLCVVYDKRVNRGVTGIVATKLVGEYKVPSILITEVDDCAVGSARSTRGYVITKLLEMCSDLLIKYGGHDSAAGFSLEKNRVPEFLERLKGLSYGIEFPENDMADTIEVAAELPEKFINKDIMKLIDDLEPYGNENEEPYFLARNIKIASADFIGKGQASHLKLTLNIAGTKWPALYWYAGERLNRDFYVGDKVDFIFKMNRNYYNRIESLQLIIKDMEKSGQHEIQ